MKRKSWRATFTGWAGFLCAALLATISTANAQESREFITRVGNRVWFYRPANAPRDARMPCVLVGTAGSRLFHGIKLADGDRPEHLPYLAAGYAVAAFDISGEWNEETRTLGLALRAFLEADLGVKDALEALDIVLQNERGIDPERVFIAGHSSAGTLALQVAAKSNRFKACIAYAPVADFETRFDRGLERQLDALAPGATKRLLAASPLRIGREINCPVFLFHAADDDRVSRDSLLALEKNLGAAHVAVTFLKVRAGGHYDSMIREGIPAAITWLKQIDR